ncbi:MAG: PKD domain-containing protein [Patescibacteria group bacterium]
MRNLMFVLVALMLVMSGCVEFDEVTPEVKDSSGYTLKMNGTILKDSIHYLANEVVLVEAVDQAGKSVIAEFTFGDGTAVVVADKATNKYAKEGVYKLTATVVNTTPAVKLAVNVVVGKTTVVNPVNGEKTVIVLDSSFVNGVNTITYGLKLDIYGLDNSAIYVEASVPGKPWSTYTNATEIIVKNGFKYVKWQVVCGNGDVRVGWYQYHTKDGLKTKEWSNTSDSKYFKDGLPEFSVYNGGTYKLGTVPTVNVYTLKVGTETFASGSIIKVTEGASLTFKVVNAANQAVMATYTVTGASSVVADSKTVVYSTAGTYDVKIETQVDATVITAKVEVTKPIATVYTLKIDDQIVTDGAIVKTTENKALYFKVVDSAGKAVLAKINFGNNTTVTTDGRSMSYATAGTYQVQVDVDAFTLKAKIEVTKTDVPVYTLKINDRLVGTTFGTVEGNPVSFKIVNSLGTAIVASYNFGDNTSETTNNASKTYTKAGTYQVTVSNGSTVLASITIIVDPLPKPEIYDFRINGLSISGTAYLVEGAVTSIKVVNIDGTAITAYMDLGNGTKLTTNNATVSYLAGIYTISASIGNTTITKKVEVTKSVIVDPIKPESIVLISSSISGSTINAILGLRCDAINNVSLTKDTYVAGEIPGVNWKDYKLSETVLIDGVRYYKWTVSSPAGKFRMSWLQMKDGGTDLYKNGSWANDLKSLFFNSSEGLFIFYLRIENNIVKLTAN